MILTSFHSNSPVDIICLGFIEGIFHAAILRRQWERIWYGKSPSAKGKISQVSKRRSGVFIVNFEHISNYFLVFLLLTLNKLAR